MPRMKQAFSELLHSLQPAAKPDPMRVVSQATALMSQAMDARTPVPADVLDGLNDEARRAVVLIVLSAVLQSTQT